MTNSDLIWKLVELLLGSNKKEEKELNKIISRINDYEVYLYNIYLYLRKHYDIPTIEWLKKRGPNPHLQP